MKKDRRVVVKIDPEMLFSMLRGHELSEVTSDFPKDAELLDVIIDFDTRWIHFMICSDDFDEVPNGGVTPEWTPTYTDWRPTELLKLLEKK